MGRKLDPKDNELYKRADEILYHVWGPVGVSTPPAARDEYYAYLPTVFSLLQKAEDGRAAIFDETR